MTSSELQRQVKAKLESLGVPVTKYFHEYDGEDSFLCYREIANVPALHGDDKEIFFRSVYQVTIVTNNDDYEKLEAAVEVAMLSLGFMRTDTQDIFDGAFNRVLRFIIASEK